LGKWKAIKLAVTKNADASIELYDLEKDPGEMNDIAAQNPAIIKKMQLMFSKEHRYDPAWPFLYNEVKK